MHKIIIPILALSAITLIGCQSNHQPTVDTTTPNYKHTSILSRCNKITPNYEITRKNALPYYKCVLETKTKYGSAADNMDIDLDKKRYELAKEYAAGKITDAEFQSYNSDLGNRWTENRIQELNQENQRQQAAADAADSQRRQAAAYLIGSGALNRSYTAPQIYQPVPVRPTVPPIPRPITTNCNSMGNSTNCTTF